MKRALLFLRIDSLAGLSAGLGMMVLGDWLTNLYAWPPRLIYYIGFVNIFYGCCSGTLALRFAQKKFLPRWTAATLIAANFAWGVVCLILALWIGPMGTYFGIAHLALEGAFVAGLALIETRTILPYVDGSKTDS